MNKRYSLSYLLVILFLPFYLLDANADTVAIDHIVAVVNNDVITSIELDKREQLITKQLTQKGIQLPESDNLRKQVLEHLIHEKLQLQLAERMGVTIDHQSLDQAVLNIAKQNNFSLSDFRKALESDGYDYAQFRHDLENEMIMQKTQQRLLAADIVVTEKEIQQRVSQMKKANESTIDYNLAHILIALPENPSPADIQAAKEKTSLLDKKLQAGTSFAQLAIEYSDGQQALKGGELGWRKGAELPTLLAEVIEKLEIGEVKGPIRNSNGFNYIKLIDRKSADDSHNVQQTKVQHILLQADPILSGEAVKKRLESIRERILDGENFATLAQAYSEDSNSASHGGDLGWIEPGKTDGSFEEMMNKTAISAVSPVFQSPYGWHILKVLARRQQNSSEEHLYTMAHNQIFQRKFQDALQTWIIQLRDQALIEIREHDD